MKITSLSPSMVNTYLKCGRQFYYRNCIRIPALPSWYMAFGSAFHETLRENYFQKIRTSKDLPTDLLTDFFAEDLEYRDADWSEQSRDDTLDQGVISLREYQAKVAPKTMPRDVEYAFTLDVIGRPWKITGKVDLIGMNVGPIETKTTGKRLSKPKPDNVFQIATYAAARMKQMGVQNAIARMDYVIRGKEEVITFPFLFDKREEQNVLTTFDQVATGIQNEVWIPNRYHFLCSRKYCPFWMNCEKDCGGVVDD